MNFTMQPRRRRLTPELTERAHNAGAIQVLDERQAHSRFGPMSCYVVAHAFRRAERHLFRRAACCLTLNAMCVHHGLIQFASAFNQPLALSLQLCNHTTEARRDSTMNSCEAETYRPN